MEDLLEQLMREGRLFPKGVELRKALRDKCTFENCTAVL